MQALRDLAVMVSIETGDEALRGIDKELDSIVMSANDAGGALDELGLEGAEAGIVLDRSFRDAGLAVDSLHSELTLVSSAMTAVSVAAFSLVGNGIAQAGDYIDQIRKFGVVFGDYSGAVTQWIDEMGYHYGMSELEAVKMAASYADLVIPMGATREEASALVPELMNLTGALAYFNGVSRDRAYTALSGALAGEAEGMKRLGADVRAAAIETFALEKGIVSSVDELEGFLRQQAVVEKVLKDSADAMRGAMDTSGSLDIQIAKLTGRFGDFIREGSEPMSRSIADLINSSVDPLLDRILDDRIAPSVMRFTGITGALAGIVGVPKVLTAVLTRLGLIEGSVGAVMLGFGKWLILLAGAALLIEDIMAWVMGNESLTGNALDAALGRDALAGYATDVLPGMGYGAQMGGDGVQVPNLTSADLLSEEQRRIVIDASLEWMEQKGEAERLGLPFDTLEPTFAFMEEATRDRDELNDLFTLFASREADGVEIIRYLGNVGTWLQDYLHPVQTNVEGQDERIEGYDINPEEVRQALVRIGRERPWVEKLEVSVSPGAVQITPEGGMTEEEGVAAAQRLIDTIREELGAELLRELAAGLEEDAP